MTAVVGRVWGWVSPVVYYRPWGSGVAPVKDTRGFEAEEKPKKTGGWGLRGLTTWLWGGRRTLSTQGKLVEEYYFEAEDKPQAMKIEDLGAGRPEVDGKTQRAPRWWNRFVPSWLSWSGKTEFSRLRHRKCVGWNQGAWDSDNDGELSDYETPPPSPMPPSRLSAPFRLFAQTWKGEILPEHYEICFNFLRHLFDLFTVGFLWTVSPPAKLVLEVLGVQGGLKLWLHGMAMFFVSTVGMAGLLWLVQEYLPEFALVYGIVQALVISVSVRQSVILGVEEEKEEKEVEVEEKKEIEGLKDTKEIKEEPVIPKPKRFLTAKERLCFESVGI